TCLEDAEAAVAAGADALGFNFAESPRRVTPEQAAEIIRALPPFVTTVGMVVDQDVEAIRRVCPLDVIQFHGSESPELLAAARGPSPWMSLAVSRLVPAGKIAPNSPPSSRRSAPRTLRNVDPYGKRRGSAMK